MTGPLITITQAAELCGVSRSTIYRHLQARAYEQAIVAGEKQLTDMPFLLQMYFASGFPEAIRISPRCLRLDRAAVESWRDHTLQHALQSSSTDLKHRKRGT